MNDATLDQLIDDLKQGDDASREAAALALGAWNNRALAPLCQLLTGGPDERWWAVRALAVVGTPQALVELSQLVSDTDPDVRACAAHGLGETLANALSEQGAHQDAMEDLAHLLGDDSAYVGRIASNALIRVGEPAIPTLIGALGHPSPAARAGAARALVPLKSQDAIPALYAALDDDSALVSHYATQALEKLGVGIILLSL